MAFTEAQKVKIRLAIGHADVFRDRNSRLEDAMDIIGTRADTQTQVESILTQLDAVTTSLNSSLSFAGLKRAEDVEWYQSGSGSAAIDQKRAEGRRLCSQLSIMFGVPLVGDMFGTSGYQGDAWSSAGHQYGGVIKLG